MTVQLADLRSSLIPCDYLSKFVRSGPCVGHSVGWPGPRTSLWYQAAARVQGTCDELVPGSAHASPVTERDQITATNTQNLRPICVSPLAASRHTRSLGFDQPSDRRLRARPWSATRLRCPCVQAMG